MLLEVSLTNNLTHICLVDPSVLINWTSPFSILGVSSILFHFYSFLLANSEDPDQTPRSALFAYVPNMGLIWAKARHSPFYLEPCCLKSSSNVDISN